MENGARYVFNEAPAGTVSVFPQGAIHFEQNNGCDPVMFVAAFNNEDAGVTALAQRVFGIAPDIIGAALGGLTPEEVATIEAKIPNNIALGADECLKRCNITRPTLQAVSQRQTRNAGNALPSGFSGVADTPALYPANATIPAAGALAAAPARNLDSVSSGGDSSTTGNGSISPLALALIIINGVFVASALVAIGVWVKRRSAKKDNLGKYMAPGDIHK